MSAHVLLKSLNQLKKKDMPSILLLFAMSLG